MYACSEDTFDLLSQLCTFLLRTNHILLVEHSHKLFIANIIDTLQKIWKLGTLDTH